MYYRTAKLKRYKALYFILNVIVFPVRFPIFLVYVLFEKLSKILENVLEFCDGVCWRILNCVVKALKFNEVADKQYEENKEKFK